MHTYIFSDEHILLTIQAGEVGIYADLVEQIDAHLAVLHSGLCDEARIVQIRHLVSWIHHHGEVSNYTAATVMVIN